MCGVFTPERFETGRRGSHGWDYGDVGRGVSYGVFRSLCIDPCFVATSEY